MTTLHASSSVPQRRTVWVAVRADGRPGAGTESDPYDGSSAEKLGAVMRKLTSNTCLRMGPGLFVTQGYCDRLGGEEPQAGMRIVGAGIDVTTIQLANGQATDDFVYAFGHALSGANLKDFFEISDLTIDCNLAGVSGASSAAGAIRVMGNHVRVARIKVVNWGNRGIGGPPFVLGVLTADDAAGVFGVVDCGIADCIAVDPHGSATGPMIVLHVGGRETAVGQAGRFAGIGPFIRNCFVDCGQSSATGFAVDYRALSMAWCRGGVVEGNQVHNTRHGGPMQTATGAQDLVIRNNVLRNVRRAVYLNPALPGIRNLVVEGNSIELASTSVGTEYAIQLESSAAPPVYSHGNVIVRNNRIRYVDDSLGAGNGIRIVNANNASVRENVLDVTLTQPESLLCTKNCGSVEYFENRTSAGRLLRGYNQPPAPAPGYFCNELETEAEEALLLGMIRGR